MSQGPTAAEIEYAFYEKFFFSQGLEPYAVQEEAFAKIFAEESVLVTVPTGTGKTLMAKAAIYKALQRGQTAIYTTPLRALTEEKFRELCVDFGEENVGFATGDYKVNHKAPVQVVVAEILWNRIFGDRVKAPADVVIMDEGHYFNDPERGYVWEQSIIGLDPRTQLVVLSATVGNPDEFCEWVYSCRRIPMALVQGFERRVPLYHEYREEYLLDVVKDLFFKGEHPAILFVFGREQCFEVARLLKSCRRFTTDEERAEATLRCDAVLHDRGVARDLKPLLLHGIGIHHAGILPVYKRLVEELTLARLVKFVVSTETISAGINLPAKRVVFPSLRKFIKKKARLLSSAEYHQMSGRAGRPQFDTEGVAITLAPEEVVQQIQKEEREAAKARYTFDLGKARKSAYSRARADAMRTASVAWDPDIHRALVEGKAAPLRSQTRISADQILAVGLPDLAALKAAADAATAAALAAASAPEAFLSSEPSENTALPASMDLNIRTVIAHLLVDPHTKMEARARLDHYIENLVALGIVDEHGQQISGEMIRSLRGIDGPFVHYAIVNHDLLYADLRQMVEFLVDHDSIHRLLTRKDDDKKYEWIKNRLRERRGEETQVSWDDVEAEYNEKFPRILSPIEVIHQEFLTKVPHQELHGGKVQKQVWATMEDAGMGFWDFVEAHSLELEEGNLFSYLARVMRLARMLFDATKIGEFEELETRVRNQLAVVDERIVEEGRRRD